MSLAPQEDPSASHAKSELVPKLDVSNLSAADGSSESTALQEVSDTANGLRGSASELAGLLSSAQECMKRHALLADTYHEACMQLMQKHANSASRPLQAQLEEAHAVNAELEGRVRSLNDRLQYLESERAQLQAFKDNITGMVQQSLVPSPARQLPPARQASPDEEGLGEQPGTPEEVAGIGNLASSLVPKAMAPQQSKLSANAAAVSPPPAATDAPVGLAAPTPGAAPTSQHERLPGADSTSHTDADAVPLEAASDTAAETGHATGAPMDDTVEGITAEAGAGEGVADAAAVREEAAAPAAAAGQEQEHEQPNPSYEDVCSGGVLRALQLSSGRAVPVTGEGLVLGRSTATQHNLEELGLKVHRKHLQITVQAAEDGSASLSVQRLGLNAASVIAGRDAQALGLLGADGNPMQEDVDVSALVAAAEAKECVHAVGKKHAKAVHVGDVLVLCNSLQGAFLLQCSPPNASHRGSKRPRSSSSDPGPDSVKVAKSEE